MKKIAYTIALITLLIPNLLVAAGYHVDGRVDIYETGTMHHMQATMNVRYNTSIGGSPLVYAYGYANSAITIGGRDSDNDTFICYIATSSPLYAAAVDIKNNFTNGGAIRVTREKTSSACASLFHGNYSSILD